MYQQWHIDGLHHISGTFCLTTLCGHFHPTALPPDLYRQLGSGGRVDDGRDHDIEVILERAKERN